MAKIFYCTEYEKESIVGFDKYLRLVLEPCIPQKKLIFFLGPPSEAAWLYENLWDKKSGNIKKHCSVGSVGP